MTKAKIKLLTGIFGVIASVALVGGSTMAWFTDTKHVAASTFTAGTVQISAGQKTAAGSGGSGYYEGIQPASVVYQNKSWVKETKFGRVVNPLRSNPESVLKPDGTMFSLGFTGCVTVKLEKSMNQGDVLVVEDTWGGTKPDYEETADVYVSSDCTTWVKAGSVSNLTNPDGDSHDCTVSCPIQSVLYVKVQDTTDSKKSRSADGFDVDYICGRNTEDSNEVNWNPGDQNKVAFYVSNIGTKDIQLRAKLDPKWVGKDGKDAEGLSSDVVDISLPDDSGWALHDDGFYYYDGYLRGTKGGETDEAKTHPTQTDLNLNVTLKGNDAGNRYQGMTFQITPTFEAIQNSHDNEWNWNDFEDYNPAGD